MTGHDLSARVGRPRDPACDAAILQATRDVFAESGYSGVSIEGIASRAGVGKATIYRRYPTKAQLVVEAVRGGALMDDVLRDTGDLRADLTSMMRPLVERLNGEDGDLLRAFAAERSRHPDLAEEWDRSVIGKKREHLRRLVAAAVDRGDLRGDCDVELVAEVAPAVIWHHALSGLAVDERLLQRIVDLIVSMRMSEGVH